MKRFTFFFFGLLTTFLSQAQPYGNEWINYSQQHYKIQIYQDGIYRISYNTLLNAGIPVSTINPGNFQVFGRGEEQYIYVHGEADGVFDQGDYIEFFGRKNDGWYDTQLYKLPTDHINKNYSLFTDTAIYYLTWNTSLSNRRMAIESDVNFGAYTAIPYFLRISRMDYTYTYFRGEPNAFGVPDPDYSAGEGWFGSPLTLGGSRSKNIPTANAYASGSPAEIEFVVIGASNYSGTSPDHHLRVTFPTKVIDTLYEGYTVVRFNYTIPASSLGSSSTNFLFRSIDDLGSGADRNAVAYVQIKYPQAPNLGNTATYRFYVEDNLQTKSLLNITNFNVTVGDTARLYDLTNFRRIKVVRSGSNFQVLVPNGGGEKECYITSDSETQNIQSLTPVSTDPGNYAKFRDYTSGAYLSTDYLIITHKSLLLDAASYKNYRNSTGFNANVFDVEDLYDQFSYGINRNPLAIKNFLKYAYTFYNQPPKYVFLVGKSFKARDYRKDNQLFDATLVPTFGDPPSDILFTSGIVDNLYSPAISTGRLSAQTSDHVDLYLDKVIQFENARKTPQTWMKNILHFGGGASVGEQSLFVQYLSNYEKIIEDTLFGGHVTTFLKTSSAPIQINQSDKLKNLINGGVSMMTFFGHAGGVGFDNSIDNPADYNNTGKYPFLLANSCYAGDIFHEGSGSSGASSSEQFVLIRDKGVIGYLASITAASAFYLDLYSVEFYKNLSSAMYGQSIGDIIQKTIRNIQNPNPIVKDVCMEMTLHGDPAIVLNSFSKPDFQVTSQDIFYTPQYVSTDQNSFQVSVVVKNIAKAVNDSIIIELEHTYPNMMRETIQKNIAAPYFSDTIVFELPVNKEIGTGINKFRVTVDVFGSVDEISETNNTAQSELFIKSADIFPVVPHKYAIVPLSSITLKASTSDPFASVRDYIFELDTTDSFNSPMKVSGKVSHAGGVVEWPLQVILSDSTIYFWRVSKDSTDQNGYNWRVSSFQYIPNKTGWSQSHFSQFGDNSYVYVSYNKPLRKFEFVNNIVSLYAKTGWYPNIAWNEIFYRLNNAWQAGWSCFDDVGHSMVFAVIDPESGKPWLSYNRGDGLGQYLNKHCQSGRAPMFEYATVTTTNPVAQDTTWFQRMKAFIDTIPTGHYVLVYSHRNTNAHLYPEYLRQAFESIGSFHIRTLQNSKPYLLFGKKGSPPGSAKEVIGVDEFSVIQLEDSITTKWYEGSIESELIGPSVKWNSLYWKSVDPQNTGTDSVRLCIVGIKADGQQDTLARDIEPVQETIANLDSIISANDYPYMKLVAFMRDDAWHTPAQMQSWQVYYDGVPETVLDPSKYFTFYRDSIQEGDSLQLSIATNNISSYDMDSLLISYWIVDSDRSVHPILIHRKQQHPSGHILVDTVKAPTLGLAGHNSFWIEINPDNDQPEQTHINNIGEFPFFVMADEANPLLDVTFDGVHILDGDIVSAKPEIQITLRDENRFLVMNSIEDTALFKVFIRKSNAIDPQRVHFVSNAKELMRFIPASATNNYCRIEYRAGFPEDGTYELIVQAKDKSGNKSGDIDYKISFEVINKSTITEVMNWPNPFTTSTRFVFTLTGSKIPTYFKIQIMTITGKIVREITQDEIGPINIGRNITQYAWDGTDEFGDRLANGIYLYRVITSIDGQGIEKRQTEASKYFTKEFGKMYLMR